MYDTDVQKLKDEIDIICNRAAFEESLVDTCALIAEALKLVLDQIPTRYDHMQD